MIGWLTNIVILGALAFGIVNGHRRGFFAVGGSLLALLTSIVIAGFGYRMLGGLIASVFHAVSSLANLIAYGVLIVGVQFLFLLLLHHSVKRLPRHVMLSRTNIIGGIIVSVLEMMIVAAIGLGIIASLPVSLNTINSITHATLAKPLVVFGNGLQTVAHGNPGKDLTDTLNLLTVAPESEQVVTLGFTASDMKIDEQAEIKMLEYVNQERLSRGLRALEVSESARDVARSHSKDMFVQGYFSHKSLDGRSPFDRMKAGGVAFHSAGENIALAPTLTMAHNGLMNSPGHRANILSPNYHKVGIGILVSPTRGMMVTQDFTD
jgi:uncharacterized protein YkwD